MTQESANLSSANPMNLICHSEESARENCETLTDWRGAGEFTGRPNPVLIKGMHNLKEKFAKTLMAMTLKEKIWEKEKQAMSDEIKKLKGIIKANKSNGFVETQK